MIQGSNQCDQIWGNFKSLAILELASLIPIRVNDSGVKQNHAHLKKLGFESNPPWFPRQGIFILGQEQEDLCGGFDNYDSLSADVAMFQVKMFICIRIYETSGYIL